MGGDSRANVRGRGSDLLSSPMPGKSRASDIMQIYLRGIYCYKELGYDSQRVPAVQGFNGWKVIPAIPCGEGGLQWLQMTGALYGLIMIIKCIKILPGNTPKVSNLIMNLASS